MAANTKKKIQKASKPSRAATGGAPQETIARRAYELYLARAGNDGSDIGDWLQAEQELCGVNPAPE